MSARMCRDCGAAFLGGGWPGDDGDEDEYAAPGRLDGICAECYEDALRDLAAGRRPAPVNPHDDPWWLPEMDCR